MVASKDRDLTGKWEPDCFLKGRDDWGTKINSDLSKYVAKELRPGADLK